MKVLLYRHNNTTPAMIIRSAPIAYYELTVVLSGSLVYYVNKQRTELKKNDAVFITPGQIRSREATDKVDYISFNFLQENKFLQTLPTLIKNGVTNEIKLLLSAGDEILRKNFAVEQPAIVSLLSCILCQLELNVRLANQSKLTQEIKQYINKHLGEQITIDDIAKSTCYSPAHCAAVFKKETGKSIIDYAIGEKISEAKRLLSEDVSLNEIAERLGFEDYNYFSRTFKKRIGYTPLRYRTTFYR